MTIVHAMACDDKNNVVLSVSVPDVRDPDRPDVGDRVAFMVKGQARYGLIVVYRDMNDTAGIVPDGERRIRWEHIANIELITDERV